MNDASLLREVSRVQHDKTIQSIRDLIDTIPVTRPGGRNNWDTVNLSAKEFRDALVSKLVALREVD